MNEQKPEKPTPRAGKQLMGLWSLHGATEDQIDEIANEIYEAVQDSFADGDTADAQKGDQ